MHFDLNCEVRTQGEFRSKFEYLVGELVKAEAGSDGSAASETKSGELVMDIFSLCRYNSGLLVPYFFPQYPYGEPLSMMNRPFALSLFDLNIGGYTVVRAGRQIGKSTALGARQLLLSHIIPKYRSMYIAPHPNFLDTYANRLREMERAFRFQTPGNKFRQNLKYKEYPNGSVTQLIKVLSSASEARSKTTDEALYDEYQLFEPEFEPEIQQCQKASKLPSTMYAGTSTTLSSPLETVYSASSMGTWIIQCGCGCDVDCGDKNQVLTIIRPEGPTCPQCSRPLRVESGFYKHHNEEALAAGFKGLHTPQIIVPEYANNLLKWNEIYTAFVKYPAKQFLQEVVGIPTEEGARELSLQELQNICMPGVSRADLVAKAKKRGYRYVVSGCDWGGSDYNPAARTKVSYTVHAMLGILPNGDMDIIHMRRYAGMGYREIVNQIMQDHVALGGVAVASDFGVGGAYNMLIRESGAVKPERHLILGYVGPRSAPIAPPKGDEDYGWFNQFSLNKTDSITKLFEAIKRDPAPRLRCYNWLEAADMLNDFMNLFRVPIEMPGGSTTFKYQRHGSRADDTLHAVNFAYVLARLMLNEPLVEDKALAERLMKMLRGDQKTAMPAGFKMPSAISG